MNREHPGQIAETTGRRCNYRNPGCERCEQNPRAILNECRLDHRCDAIHFERSALFAAYAYAAPESIPFKFTAQEDNLKIKLP